jgi:hypothetical protein
MSFASPIGLLALLAVPAVLALHLFRRRLAERPVAGAFLWAAGSPRAAAGRRRSRLRSQASLWLELALAVAIGLWLGGLRLGVAAPVPHLVLVLDDSASMAGRGAGGAAAAVEGARAAARSRLGALPADGLATLIRSGSRPALLAGPRAPAEEALRALELWRPRAPGHDLGPALDLAAEVGGPAAEISLWTDRLPRGVEARVRIEAFGAPAPNAAVLSARRVRVGGVETVYGDLRAFGRSLPARVEIVDAEGAVLVEVTSLLEPGLVRHLEFALPVAALDQVLSLRLVAEDDGLGVDDEFPLPVPLPKTVRIHADLEPGLAARLGLERLAAILPELELVADAAAADLRFVARAGALGVGRHEVVVAPLGPEGATDPWIGPYLIDRRSGLVEGLTLDGVVWTAGRGSLPGDALVLAGDQVLCAVQELAGAERLRLHLNLELRRSNLGSSPDWPILLTNLVDEVRQRLPGLVDPVVPVGGPVRYRGEGLDRLRLVGPDGTASAARGEGLATFETGEPGLHRIERDGVVVATVGVAFVDPDESDLGGRDAFVRPAVEASPAGPAADERPGRNEARVLALLALALLLADALVLRAASRGGAGR